MEERLQKILANAGYGSRRACELFITAGRVRVNGKLAELGSKADPDVDKITLDNKIIPPPEARIYVALYKPRGVLSTVEAPDPRTTVRELVDMPGNIYPVGRLDVDSEGLILLTNDGSLADQLTHPKYHHAKEYRVLVARQPDNEQLEAFRHGVVLPDGYRTKPAEVRLETLQGKGAWMNVVLYEGRKRQIRETCSSIGLPVVRIVRTRIATLKMGNLKPGQWRHLKNTEITALKDNSKEPLVKPGRTPGRTNSQAVRRNYRPAGRPAPSSGNKPQQNRSRSSGTPQAYKAQTGRPPRGYKKSKRQPG